MLSPGLSVIYELIFLNNSKFYKIATKKVFYNNIFPRGKRAG